MIRFCLEQWNKNNKKLEEVIRNDATINGCDYKYLFQLIVEHILNDDCTDEKKGILYDKERIVVIDDGDGQGTLLFLVPLLNGIPAEYDYLMSFVDYGSCAYCDVLESIQLSNFDDTPTEQQVKDYMKLCLDLVCNIIRPYNNGWREEEMYQTVEFERLT